MGLDTDTDTDTDMDTARKAKNNNQIISVQHHKSYSLVLQSFCYSGPQQSWQHLTVLFNSFAHCDCEKRHHQRGNFRCLCWIHTWRSCAQHHNRFNGSGHLHIQVRLESGIIITTEILIWKSSNRYFMFPASPTLWCLKRESQQRLKSQKKNSSATPTRGSST